MDYSSKAPKTDEIQQMNLFGEAAKTIDKFNLAISEDFNLDEKLNKEKEFLGFYLSSHTLDRYKNVLTTFSIKKLSEFDLEGNQSVKTFGTITNLKKIITKKEEQMAMFNLICYDRTVSCIVFPRVYERFITEIIEKKTVYIEGKIQIDNYKGERTSKLLVDKLVELDKIYEYPAKKLFILIEPEDSYRYSRLKNLINSNKGKTQITFAIKNKDEKKLQTINKGVKLSKEFFKNLVELMGIGKIKFEM